MTPQAYRAALLRAATAQDAARMEQLSRAQAWSALWTLIWSGMLRLTAAPAKARRRRVIQQ